MDAYGQDVVPNSPYQYFDASVYHSALYAHTRLMELVAELPDFKFPKLDPLPQEYRVQNRRRYDDKVDVETYATLGGVLLELSNNTFWVRLFPTKEFVEEQGDNVYMPKVKNVKASKETYLPPRKVKAVLAQIMKTWGTVVDSRSDEITELITKAESLVTVGYSANQPATVLLTRGAKVKVSMIHPLRLFKPDVETKISIQDALDLERQSKKVEFLIHPALSDIVTWHRPKTILGNLV